MQFFIGQVKGMFDHEPDSATTLSMQSVAPFLGDPLFWDILASFLYSEGKCRHVGFFIHV